MLSKGWRVIVIAHILATLTNLEVRNKIVSTLNY
jgi:hypothetical protein